MKKKLMFLAMGVVATCSAAFSQVNVNEVINNTPIAGVVTNVNPNTTLSIGTQITFVSAGTQYTYAVTTVPSSNPAGMLALIANAINNAFNAANVVGTNNVPFGSNNPPAPGTPDFSLNFVSQQQVPFDFGISAVLGAGALAAVKTARKRRKEAEAIA